MRELNANQLARAVLQTGDVHERRLYLWLHLLAGSPVEIHNDGVLGSKVIIGGPERDAGVLPDVPHRGRFESPFPK